MSHIEVSLSLVGHYKTKRVMRSLGASVNEVIGSLVLLWSWAIVNAPTGDLTGFDAAEIAEESGWRGDPQAWIDALLHCGKDDAAGFLEIIDGKLCIHDWFEGAGKLVEYRNTKAYQKWLRSNKLQDTQENYDIWSGRKAKRPPEKLPEGSGDSPPRSGELPEGSGITKATNIHKAKQTTKQSKEVPATSSSEEKSNGVSSGNGLTPVSACLPVCLPENKKRNAVPETVGTRDVGHKAYVEEQIRLHPQIQQALDDAEVRAKERGTRISSWWAWRRSIVETEVKRLQDVNPPRATPSPPVERPKRPVPPDWLPGVEEKTARKLCNRAQLALQAAHKPFTDANMVPEVRRQWKMEYPDQTPPWEDADATVSA